MFSTADEAYAIIRELQSQVEELQSEKLAMAILLVKGAGGKIVVTEVQAMSLSNTSYIQEDRDVHTGNRIFTTWEKPTEGLH